MSTKSTNVSTQKRLGELIQAFEEAAGHFLDEANNDLKEEELILQMLTLAYKNFTRESRLLTSYSCPGGVDPCPDGSCPPC
jgi:hypothetical protein